MPKHVEFQQLIACSVSYDRFEVPRIRDGDRWRIIENAHLVQNPHPIYGCDLYEDAIHRTQQIMQQLGWHTRITETRQDSGAAVTLKRIAIRIGRSLPAWRTSAGAVQIGSWYGQTRTAALLFACIRVWGFALHTKTMRGSGRYEARTFIQDIHTLEGPTGGAGCALSQALELARRI